MRRHVAGPVALAGLVVLLLVVLGGAGSAGALGSATAKPSASKVLFFSSDGMRPDLMESYASAGVMPTYKALMAAGLEIVDPQNQTFDPKLHEAVSTEPALSAEDDHVVSRVYQVGYLFNGQLLRPARVVVKQWNQG